MGTRFITCLAMAGVVSLVAACASTQLDEPKPAPVADKSAAPPTPPAPSEPRAVAKVDMTPAKPLDPLLDPHSPLAKRSVYFDFDRFDVKPEFNATVEAHGRYLAGNRGRRTVIEGHADERGSREYNLALGQRRSAAVKSRLLLFGATDAQVDSISFGKERPRAPGHDEAAWAENRRADIVYK